jgi:hypothetical protein
MMTVYMPILNGALLPTMMALLMQILLTAYGHILFCGARYCCSAPRRSFVCCRAKCRNGSSRAPSSQ